MNDPNVQIILMALAWSVWTFVSVKTMEGLATKNISTNAGRGIVGLIAISFCAMMWGCGHILFN